MYIPTVPAHKNEITDISQVPRTEETVVLKADATASTVEPNPISSDDSDSTATPSPESHVSPLAEDDAVQLNAGADMINVATIRIIPKGRLTKPTDTKPKDPPTKPRRT